MTMPRFTKRGLYRYGLSVWNNLPGLHRALASTLSNTFGMNWITDCKPGLIAHHQFSTSQMLLWLNEWKQVPATMSQHLLESLPRRMGSVITAKGDQLNINDFRQALYFVVYFVSLSYSSVSFIFGSDLYSMYPTVCRRSGVCFL